jgi:hypothetical protein
MVTATQCNIAARASFVPLPTDNPKYGQGTDAINKASQFLQTHSDGCHGYNVSNGRQAQDIRINLSRFIYQDPGFNNLNATQLDELDGHLDTLYAKLTDGSNFYSPSDKTLKREFDTLKKSIEERKEELARQTPQQPTSTEQATDRVAQPEVQPTPPPEGGALGLDNDQPISFPFANTSGQPAPKLLNPQQLAELIKKVYPNFTLEVENWSDFFKQGMVDFINDMTDEAKKRELLNTLNFVYKSTTGRDWDGNPLPSQ